MKRLGFVFLLLSVMSAFAAAQDQKPWSEWDKKQVEKMLNGSAWGQTQTTTDTSEMNVTMGVSNSAEGSNNQAIGSNYRIRFFSARPIREAFARKVMLDNPKVAASQLQNFVNGDYSESIVVAVAYDSLDRRYFAKIDSAFKGARTEALKSKAYLQTKDGKNLYIDEYVGPSSDGTGAKFVFPRTVDGKPFFADPNEVVRFVASMGEGVNVSVKFKVADMMYGGKLEY